MPELPEVETVRRSLQARLIGARVRAVEVRRPDVCTPPPGVRLTARTLLAGATITRLHRHGKQLAIVSRQGPALAVHLGMTGQLLLARSTAALPRPDHLHVLWRLDTAGGPLTLVFRDARRFGGVWAFRSFDDLVRTRWAALGPDGLGLAAPSLRRRLAGTRRSLKAALLDQGIVAGVGNIYADEALFRARLLPSRHAGSLGVAECARLAAAVRAVLALGIRRRGASLRDFVDADLRRGTSQDDFRVYGRGGLPCPSCGEPLRSGRLAQRTTVWCRACQH